MNEFEIPDVIMINGVEYVREDKTKPHRDITHPQYIMNIRGDDIIDCIAIKINDTVIMEIGNQEVSLYDEADILKKWADGGYLCDHQSVQWNNAKFYLYHGKLYCAYPCGCGYNDEMMYNFKTMKQGDRTQAPVPIWEHSETLKVI